MPKSLLRMIIIGAALFAALPAVVFATSVDLSVSSVSGSPGTITLGTGDVTYSVSIFNGSATAGTSPTLTITLPTNSTYVSASATGTGASCTPGTGTVTCTWPSIGASNTFTATIVVTPTAGGTLTLSANVAGADTDPNNANNSGSGSVICNDQIDLRVSSVSGSPSTVTLGTGNVSYFASIFNASTSQGTNPSLLITLPSSSTYVSASATGTGANCTPGSGTVTCTWPSILASNTFTATIVVTPTAGGTLALSANVSGTEPDPTPSNNSGSGSVTCNDQIDLTVSSVSASPTTVTLGAGNITYFASIFNASTSQATNPVLAIALPASSTYVSASATGTGANCTPGTGTVTCTWPSILSSNQFTATIVVTPTAGGTATLSASVTSDQPDSNSANNNGSASVTVNDHIDLTVSSVSASPSTVTLGAGNITYFASIFNASTSQATNPVLAITLPTNSTWVSSSVTGTGGSCTGTSTVTCTWPSILSSNQFTATIVVTPTAGGTATLSASVASDQPDSISANNSGSASVTVNDHIDLTVSSVSASPTTITLGAGNITYFASIFNASTSQATNPVLAITLPASSTYVSASATGTGANCTPGTGTVTCTWPSILSSNQFTATIVVTPTAGGTATLSASATSDQPDSNSTNNNGSASVTVNDHIDLTVSSVSASPSAVTLGAGNITYFASIFNASTSQATNPVLAITLPASSTLVSASATGIGANCTPGTGTATCTWPSILSSNQFTATIVVTPTVGGTATLSASVASDQPDSISANNSGSASVTVNDHIDLTVSSVSASPDPITFGAGNVTFFASIFDASTSQGTNPSLVITLPTNSTWVSSSVTGTGGSCTGTSTVTCTWPSILSSNQFTATIVVTPTIPGSLTLSASVSGDQPDSNNANNTGSKTTTVTPTSCTAVPSGAVAWYRAENNGVDSAGPNFATANGGVTYTTGKAGQAFSLNGTSGYVSAPDNITLRPSSLALETWVWFSSIPSTGVIVSKTVGSGANDSYLLWYQGGALHGVVGNTSGPGTIVDYTWTPSLNTWYHVAFVYDAAGQAETLYVNGAAVGTATTSTTIGYDANPLLIGAEIENSTTQYFFPGLIDEVTLYNRALSQSEVQTVYGAGTFGKCFVAPSAPSISGFTPSTGNAGASIVISGANFTSVSGVKFNGTSATFVGDSASQITATVPAGATTGTISVITGGGTATSGSSFTALTAAHWINSSGGNWNTGSNWSTGAVPTTSNDVVIDASGTYTVTLDVTPAFNSLTIGGGVSGTQTLADTTTRDITFTNPGTITTSGVLALSSGRLLGAGGLTVNGVLNWNSDSEIDATVAVAAGASMNISGSGTRFLNGGAINNSGTINWSGTDNISVYSGGVINNLSGGLLLATNDQQIYQHCCSAGLAFNNAGTFRKTTATGATTIQSNGFNNTGTVDIQSGTFVPSSGGTSSGIFNATGTGAFLFNNSTYNLTTGAALTGSGNFQISAGQLNVSSSTVSVDHITMTGGNLNINAAGAVTTSATGVIDWSADSTLSGAGALTISSGGTLNISGAGTRYIDGGTLNNNGTVNWSGTNNLSVVDSGVINNLGTGLFSVKNDQQIYQHCCSAGQAFNNAGTFRKTVATGTTTIQNNGFNNSGTVDIQSGTFNPSSGGTSTAVFQTTAAGTFLFTTNTYTLATGATLTGAGNFQLSSGQLTVNATGVSVDHMTINGGILSVGGSLSTSASGVIDWTADAKLTGAGPLTISTGGTLNVNGFGTRRIDAGTLTNNGTINWSGANNISVVNSGVINNQTSGLFSVKNDQIIYQECCSAGLAFNNAGTLRKSVATGTTTIQNNGFTNTSTGTVDIQTGTFNPASGGTSTGIFNAASGATVLFNNNTYTLGLGATLTGSGNFQVSGGTLLVNATGVTVDHLTMTGGTMNIAGAVTTSATGVVDWTADSTLTGAGALTLVSGATMNINGSGTRYIDGGTLNNSGTVNWSGANNISVYDSGIINNQAGGVFSVKNDQIIYQHCCAAGQAFNNIGTFRKSVATGTTTIQNNGFTNTGTVDIQSGTFFPSSGGTSSANFNAASGATFLFNTSTYTLASGATLTGSGNFQVGGATLAVNATGVTVNHLTMTGGTLNVAGSLSTTASGIVDWTSDSTLTGAGALAIASGATMNINGFGTRYIDGGTLNNSGTVNWSGANNISVVNAGIINNLAGGLFGVTNDQLIYQHCCAAGQPFNNAGTFRKTTATGTTTIQNFTNSGTLQPQSGTIAFSASFSNSGSPVYDFGIGSASTYGRLTFASPVTLTGALIAAPVNSFVPPSGQQYQIISFPSTSSATFSPKTLTFGSSPTRSFADTYTATSVTLTASGPSVTLPLSPNQGPGAGGTAVTITGTGFASGVSLGVTFGGVAATSVTAVNATTITCTTPAHASGLVDAVVTNGDGQSATVLNAYTYDLSPILSGIRPSSGSTAGSGGVIIDGSNLDTVTAIDFGGNAGTIVYSSPTQLTVTGPAHAAGAVNLVVTNGAGAATLTNGFTYVANDDPARDFFVATNPSARWSYGYESARGTAFTLYPSHGRTGAQFDDWDNGSFPNLGRNSSNTTLVQGTDFTPSMKLYFHPGASGENSVFRWTAPAAGVYRIQGDFVGLDNTWPTTSDVAILKNNSTSSTLFSAFINAYNVPQTFDVSPTLAAGDTIEFTVGFGQNSTNNGDATGLDVTIAQTGPAAADVSVVANSSTPTVISGNPFSYSTLVTNNGPAIATNAVVTIALPANVTLNGTPSSTQGSCTGTTTITCTIGTLLVSGTATQTINVTANATGNAQATATVSATEPDSNSTNNTSAASVTVSPCIPPTAAATPGGPTTFCVGGSVTLTSSPGTSYQWRNFGTPIISATAQTLVVTTSGSYSVTVSDATGCSATSSNVPVTVNSTVSVTISAVGPTTFCSGGSVTLNANPSGGSGTFSSYQWLLNGSPIGGASGTSYSATTQGSYSVTVADSAGCTATAAPTSVTVNPIPAAGINAPASACANSTAVASIAVPVAGATYTWSITNGTLLSGQGTASITFTIGTATPVSVSVVASASGCTANGNASIAVSAFIPTITASGSTSFCPGGSVTLNASSGSSYQWLLNGSPIGGATGQSYVATVAGNYSVTVTAASGCIATSSSVAVTQATAPSPTITPSGPTTFCGGGSVTLSTAVASSYQWLINGSPINGATGSSFVATASGSYTVTVTNSSGCSGTSPAVSVTANLSTATIQSPSSVTAGSTGNVASVAAGPIGSTYVWTITGGTITSGNGTPSITWTAGNSTAVINVIVTSGACVAPGTVTVAILNSADLALAMTAAPNPVSAGGSITFTLNVTNNGPDVAQNVVLGSNLFGVTAPAGSGNGWSCSTAGLTVVCTMPSLTAGAAAPLTITAIAASDGNAGNNAVVGSANSDPIANNNNATVSIPITTQVTCSSNTAPSAISPAAGATNVTNPVTFTWSASVNATSYDLWMASSGAAPAIAMTTPATTATINLPSGPSTWYVAAHFLNNCPTLFSTPRDLTVAASSNCAHNAPQTILPSPGATVNAPVTFTWTPVPQAVGYRLWVAIDGNAAQDVGTTNGATSLTVPLTGSNVSWHVDAIFPGCDPTSSGPSSFTIVAVDACASHGAPTLLAPATNATLTSSIVDFHWSTVANASGYRVWASINGSAFAPIGTTATATTLHVTFASGSIGWFVEALFNGCASVPSAQSSFTIAAAQNCNNSAPSLLAPSTGTTLANSEVDFSWSSAPNAIGYELWLAVNNGTPSPAGSTTATTLRRTVGAGTVDWFVRAQFNGCDPVESAHARFTYAPPADCSQIRPILTAPVDGAAVVYSPLDLRWSNVPGATSYKVWLASGDTPAAVIGTTPATHLDNQNVPSGSVSWFVEALFDHCPALQSTSSTFTAAPAPPPCSTPAVPLPRAESTASTNVEYLIRWTPVGPASTTQYELQEATNASFTNPLSLTINASEYPFKHVNNGDAAVPYYYRIRAVGPCNGARSLFSLPLTVQVLPSSVTDPKSANGSTPADNPQTTHYEIHLGDSNATAHKGVIAAATGDTFTATTNQPWLTVSPSSGMVSAEGTTLTVTAATDGLPVGTSTGAVNVAFGSASGSAHNNRVALDTHPATSTTVSVNLVQPVSPNAKNGPPPDALIIPAVAHADGINSKFQSDIRVTNSSAQPMKYQVTFTPTGDAGIADGKQTTIDIDPGRTIALDDVLQSWFGDSSATGTLEVRPLTSTSTSSTAAVSSGLANILTFASSRTYNATANGTFGQYIPAIPFAAFVGRASDPTKSTILSLQQIAQSPAYRTNLGIVEGSGDPASVLISVFGSNGQKLTEFTQDLKGGQHIQLNSILAQKNVQVTDGRIEVKVVTGVGKVTAYASVLDNQTNDPLLVSPVAVNQTAAARYVLPGVADLNNGVANWQTDVRLFNPSTSIVTATMTFYSQNGGTPLSKDIQLAPGQVQTLDGTLKNIFGISNDGGALHISTTATTPLVATARTYNQTPNGTYGQFIPAVTANDAAALGSRPLQILQIEESDRYRTNVGFAEVTGKAATIEVTAVPSESKVAASTQIDLGPNQFVQFPQLLRSMGLTNSYNARVSVKVISGQGKVTAYASVIDMVTNDPTFVPAQ